MAFIQASFDTKRLDRALQARSRGFKDDFADEMDAIGRVVAVSLATSAQPYGVGNNALQKGSAAVQGDIGRIYVTVGQVYNAISDAADERTAKAFSSAIRRGDQTRAMAIVKANTPEYSLALIGRFDGGALHKARRNKRGRVPKSQRVLLIVTDQASLNKYIKREVDQVGFGKAGWGNCAKAFADKGATRGLPRWVTRHKNAPCAVMKRVINNGAGIEITMVNQVEYAQNLLSASDKSQAVQIAIDRLVKNAVTAERKTASRTPLS
jgi:hypothetical protein